MKKYPSKYSNGKDVSAAQYITELICEKKAKLNKKDLHYRFWTNKEWSGFFRNQIGSANKLLKQYDELAIIKALTSQEAQKIYSLRAPHLAPIIEREQAKLQQEKSKPTMDIKRVDANINIVVPRMGGKTGKTNIINLLKDLENDQ